MNKVLVPIIVILIVAAGIGAFFIFQESTLLEPSEKQRIKLPDRDFSGLDPLLEWKQLPLRSLYQKNAGLQGGEGMQMIYDIDWNLKNTNVLYLIVDTTRVWKSVDRGNSWSPAGQELLVKGGASIVSDPNNPDVVFFAGAAMSAYGIVSDYDGIYRSLDGGKSWTGPIGGIIHFQRRHAGKLFLIDPNSFNGTRSLIIYAGTPDGVLKSTNGGDTWIKIALNGEGVYDIEWSEADRSFFYAATNLGLYKITIQNQQVTKIGAGLPSHPWDLAVSSQDANIVYAAVGTDGVYKSTDGGVAFVKKSKGLISGKSYQRIVSSRVNPDRLILQPHMIGGNFPYWSEDAAETWRQGEAFYYEETLAEGHYFAEPVIFDPEKAEVAIIKRDATLKKTTDGGRSWHFSGNGYTGARVVDINFISENKMLFCLTDYGLFLTEDKGESFKDLNVSRVRSAKSCGSSDIRGNTIVAAIGGWTEQDILLSEDKGLNWWNVNPAGENFQFIRFNTQNENIIYADKWISRDKGKTWSQVNDGYEIRAMDSRNGDIIYGIKEITKNKWQVARSVDAGRSWKALGQTISGGAGEIAVDPYREDIHLLVAGGGWGVYEYENGSWNLKSTADGLGKQWDNQGVHYVRFDPLRKGVVWAGKRGYGKHGEGIYLSYDGGKTWINVINNLGPYNDIWNVEVSPYDGKVYITGPGVWTF